MTTQQRVNLASLPTLVAVEERLDQLASLDDAALRTFLASHQLDELALAALVARQGIQAQIDSAVRQSEARIRRESMDWIKEVKNEAIGWLRNNSVWVSIRHHIPRIIYPYMGAGAGVGLALGIFFSLAVFWAIDNATLNEFKNNWPYLSAISLAVVMAFTAAGCLVGYLCGYKVIFEEDTSVSVEKAYLQEGNHVTNADKE